MLNKLNPEKEHFFDGAKLDEIRKDLAKTYNAFFAGAPVHEKMIELEEALIDILIVHDD